MVPRGEEEGHGVAAKGSVRQPGEVAADAEVHRFALPQCRGNGRVNLLVRVVQIGHHGLNPRTSKQAINQPDETDTQTHPKSQAEQKWGARTDSPGGR